MIEHFCFFWPPTYMWALPNRPTRRAPRLACVHCSGSAKHWAAKDETRSALQFSSVRFAQSSATFMENKSDPDSLILTPKTTPRLPSGSLGDAIRPSHLSSLLSSSTSESPLSQLLAWVAQYWDFSIDPQEIPGAVSFIQNLRDQIKKYYYDFVPVCRDYYLHNWKLFTCWLIHLCPTARHSLYLFTWAQVTFYLNVKDFGYLRHLGCLWDRLHQIGQRGEIQCSEGQSSDSSVIFIPGF